ncbi:hypothetical protein QJS10_CPB21g00619 [Acorus calamus]|uniref:Uncharacterized protein n=1 Tax=Acorus calamus TaxID=4465 RepID=A0AAV9C580_ACOCL|nr:hypothetical protein QJS10_CPB21g00619 [Acorus calamus]
MPNVTVSGGLSALVKAVSAGTVLIYMASNSFYNVEGGHRAIVFNRIGGIKDEREVFRLCSAFLAVH